MDLVVFQYELYGAIQTECMTFLNRSYKETETAALYNLASAPNLSSENYLLR